MLTPVEQSERINSVDVIRGVALLGILLMNIVGMALPDPAYWDPTGAGGDTGWDLRAWLINNLFFEGTMRGIFSMLFGAGVVLFTRRGEEKAASLSVADAWYRRTIWLFLFGVVHAYVLLWPGDILYTYGLMGLFLFPFRNVEPRRLFALGAGLLAIGALAYLHDNLHSLELHREAMAAQGILDRGEEPSPEQRRALDDWHEKLEKMQPAAKIKEEIVAGIQAGFLSAMAVKAQISYMFESEYHYRYSYWDVLSMMLIGMAFFKWGVFSAELPIRTYALMAIVGYGVGIPVNWFESVTYMRDGFALVSYYKVSTTYDLGRFAMIAGHIGVIMLFCKSDALPVLRRALAAVGQMALTNYILHTVITTIVFVGFAQFGEWQRHELYYLVFAIWTFQLIASPIWLKWFYFGPLEWLWRSLTYLRRPPLLRPA